MAKKQHPRDVNQLAKSIVDQATGGKKPVKKGTPKKSSKKK